MYSAVTMVHEPIIISVQKSESGLYADLVFEGDGQALTVTISREQVKALATRLQLFYQREILGYTGTGSSYKPKTKEVAVTARLPQGTDIGKMAEFLKGLNAIDVGLFKKVK